MRKEEKTVAHSVLPSDMPRTTKLKSMTHNSQLISYQSEGKVGLLERLKTVSGSVILIGQPIGVTNCPRTFVFLTPSRVKSGNCPSTMVVFGLSPVGCKATVAAFCGFSALLAAKSIKQTYGSSTYESTSRLPALREFQNYKHLREVFTSHHWSCLNPSGNGASHFRHWYSVPRDWCTYLYHFLLFQGDG